MTNVVLIVDDDPIQRRLIDAVIVKLGYQTLLAEGGEQALQALNGPNGPAISLVILDLLMPDMDGLEVLAAMRDQAIEKPVIVQTAQGGIETVVKAMRGGAFDFVVKPVSPERLQVSVTNAMKLDALEGHNKRIKRTSNDTLTFRDIISSSPNMERVIRVGEKAAHSRIPILIEGESGVGKELIARAIQGSSDRKSKPFVTVNCGALPENLVESILFGHEKGSFTGASEKRIGKFEEANGGTLFLDEIGELPLDAQVKLLRAIQEGEVDPVGAKKSIKVDIRLISATNRNLIEEVKKGNFREDLYYRLNVLPIMVPPLRDRLEDVPALLNHFTTRIAAEENRPAIKSIGKTALEMLSRYDWPGNIRQLENAVFRAVVLCDGTELSIDEFPQIAAQMPDQITRLNEDRTRGIDLLQVEPPSMTSPQSVPLMAGHEHERHTAVEWHEPDLQHNEGTMSSGFSFLDEQGHVKSVETVEAELIRFAIETYNGRMSEVARRLGIGRSTLYRKLKDYGLEQSEEPSHAGERQDAEPVASM